MLGTAARANLMQRAENRDRCEIAAHHVGNGNRDFQRLGVRRAERAHQTADSLDHAIDARPLAIRARLTEGGDRAVDEPGIQLTQCVEVESHRCHHARPKVFDEHVGLAQHAANGFAPRVGFQIDRDAVLVAVDADEGRAFTADPRRADAPPDLAVGRLDLDDVRAEIGERHRADRTGEDMREIDHPHAVEAVSWHL